jgi:hypothetical protein
VVLCGVGVVLVHADFGGKKEEDAGGGRVVMIVAGGQRAECCTDVTDALS